MKSSSSVIKSRDPETASSWLPAELEGPPHINEKLNSTDDEHTRTWLPSELEEIKPSSENIHDSEPSLESSQKEPDPLAEAKNEAEKIIASAKKDAEIILEQARQQAHKEGYQQGREAVEQELIDAATALKALLKQGGEWQADFYSSGESQILAMIMLIAEKLFGTGFQLEQEPLQAFMNQVLQRAKTLGDLRCFLNPRDINTLGNGFIDRQQAFHGVNMALVPNEDIKPGGCQIEGTFGSVDASIENRLDSILDALKETYKAGSDAVDIGVTKEGIG